MGGLCPTLAGHLLRQPLPEARERGDWLSWSETFSSVRLLSRVPVGQQQHRGQCLVWLWSPEACALPTLQQAAVYSGSMERDLPSEVLVSLAEWQWFCLFPSTHEVSGLPHFMLFS